MKKLFVLFAMMPIMASAQNTGVSADTSRNFYSKNFEVPYKTKSDVQKIGQNFLTENCMVGSVQYGDVVSHFSLPYKSNKKSCLSATINGDVIIHTWDNKTGIEFTNLTYTLPQEGGSCNKTGPLSMLYNCSKCRLATTDLKEKVDNYTSTLATKYGAYIAKINGPDGYKIYAYDYGQRAHFDYARYYEEKDGKPKKGKQPVKKQYKK